jgi:ADP-heptose:LPS heptosyltransferase
VGLVWAGNPRRGNPAAAAVDRRRSIELAGFAPLAASTGITFFSLQTGEAARAAKAPPPGLRLIDLAAGIGDFRDTAAILAGLNLLITVDTAAVHLAGALGRPVWLLNRFDTDWRWQTAGDGSPWYAALRIYRQPRPGEWGPVIERVAADLANAPF